MISMYIDESGSVHTTSKKLNRYFIIGIIIPKQPKKLKRSYKIFIKENIAIAVRMNIIIVNIYFLGLLIITSLK